MNNFHILDPHTELPRLTRLAIRTATVRPTAKAMRMRHTLEILCVHKGNVSASARALGLHRRTLQRWLLRWSKEGVG